MFAKQNTVFNYISTSYTNFLYFLSCTEQFHLNQTGILFFAKNPGYRLFHVSVICALFKGTNKAYILDRKEFNGSIIENIDESLLYLRQHLQLRWQITNANTQRQEILELPETALREAIVNALCHRDYLQEGAQVTVEIFDDRVEIYNPGGLPKGLKAEEFGTRSVCRNPLIASLLLRCHYIEKLGTGIDRIRSALTLANCPDIDVRFNTLFSLKFQRPFHLKTSEKTSEKTLKTLKTADEILRLINNNKLVTIAEMARITGVTTRSIERNLESLQTQNKIKRIGSAKGGHWQIITNDKAID
jgi:ATP-dependent DNA helicase RecG